MKFRIYLAAALMLFAFVGCDSGSTTTNGTDSDSTATGATTTPDLSGSYKVDPAKSSIKWTGTKADKPDAHSGTLNIEQGSLQLDKDGYLTGGSVTVDMKSIVNTDDMPEKMKSDLESHLKSADFFDVENFGMATFSINSVAKGASDGTYDVTGQMSIAGKTMDLTTSATVGMTGNEVNASTTLNLTESDFGFAKWAGTIEVAVMLVATK